MADTIPKSKVTGNAQRRHDDDDQRSRAKFNTLMTHLMQRLYRQKIPIFGKSLAKRFKLIKICSLFNFLYSTACICVGYLCVYFSKYMCIYSIFLLE